MAESLAEFAEVEERERRLRETASRLARQLADLKHKRSEQVDAIYRAASDAIAGLEIPPVAPPTKDRRTKGAEVAIAVLSDWQLGKVTKSYNSEVCAQRIELYADKVVKMTQIQRADHPVKEIRVYLLGDLLEGELIFPGQAHLIDASLYRQTMELGPAILSKMIRTLAANFETVKVIGVAGNHGYIGGRSRKDMHPESNGDHMLYRVTRLLTDLPNVSWDHRPGDWYHVDHIGDNGFLLVHGQQIKGFAGVPWYGFLKKIYGWAIGVIPEDFKYVLTGHFHTPFREYLNGITHWGNGSTESHNHYAAEQLASAGEPCQWLLFASPDRGVTAEYLIHLDEGDA